MNLTGRVANAEWGLYNGIPAPKQTIDMDDQFTLDEDPNTTQVRRKFERARARLKEMMPVAQWKKFIEPLAVSGREGHVVLVAAPGKFVQDWVREKYRKQLETALAEELGEDIEVFVEARLHERTPGDAPAAIGAPIAESPNDCYTFENFVTGDSNRFAREALEAAVKKLGKYCNPVYVYGPTGVGKTHLAWAAINFATKKSATLRAQYLTAKDFSQRFVLALEAGSVPKFHRSLETSKLLIVDEVPFVERGKKLQEELFHLFNTMIQEGRQLIICGDRPPRELAIEDRLRSRMQSGVLAAIDPPDTALKAQIVKAKAEQEGVILSDDVCEFLAANAPGNVRVLLGALTTLLVYSSILGKAPTTEVAREVLEKQCGPPREKTITAEQIIEAVGRTCGIQVEELIGPSRSAWIVMPRHLAMYLIRDLVHESCKHIGARFSGRDHSSVIHACRKIETLISSEAEVKSLRERVVKSLGIEAR